MKPPSLLGVSAKVETDSYFGARLSAKTSAKTVVAATNATTRIRRLQIACATSRKSISGLRRLGLGVWRASSPVVSSVYRIAMGGGLGAAAVRRSYTVRHSCAILLAPKRAQRSR